MQHTTIQPQAHTGSDPAMLNSLRGQKKLMKSLTTGCPRALDIQRDLPKNQFSGTIMK